MSHYSTHAHHCRVDFFRESGKWHTTEEIPFPADTYEMPLVQDAFEAALRAYLKQGDDALLLRGMTAVCLEPHHKYSHPVMLTVPTT